MIYTGSDVGVDHGNSNEVMITVIVMMLVVVMFANSQNFR